MKIRHGFVSNSSSSSFVCDVCGYDVISHDGLPEEMWMCENGHTLCEEHLLIETDEDKREIDLYLSYGDDCEDGEDPSKYEDGRNDIDCKFCPICQFKIIESDKAIRYLEKTRISMDEIKKEISSRFSSYDEFMNFLKS